MDAVCKTQCDPLDNQQPPARSHGANQQASADQGPTGVEDRMEWCFVQATTAAHHLKDLGEIQITPKQLAGRKEVQSESPSDPCHHWQQF